MAAPVGQPGAPRDAGTAHCSGPEGAGPEAPPEGPGAAVPGAAGPDDVRDSAEGIARHGAHPQSLLADVAGHEQPDALA